MSDSVKYKNNGFYVIYDCFNKGEKDCPTRDTWLGAFDLYINRLFPDLEKRKRVSLLKEKIQLKLNIKKII